jgi:hypothetical protein
VGLSSFAEILTALAVLAGWALLTWPVAALLSVWVWPVSGGVLLLSCVGWRLIGVIAWQGLYALTRDDEEDE